MEEILERQLLIQGGAFATFSTIEEVLMGKNSFHEATGHAALKTWKVLYFGKIIFFLSFGCRVFLLFT